MMKIHTCAIIIASRQTMAKHNGRARNKYTTWSRAMSHDWIYAQVPARGAPIRLPLKFCSSAKRPFYKKSLVLNQVIAALRRSVGLRGRFVTVWKNRTGHPPNYCNPAAHVRRGLTILYFILPLIAAAMASDYNTFLCNKHFVIWYGILCEMIVRLLEMLVESVLLYGVEAWGCGGQLDAVENVQMRAARIFLGVGRRHPLISLQFEMNMLPVKWEALRRGIEFWVQVMRMNDNRLVKVVMLEALEVGSKVKWVKDVQQSLEKLGWRGLNVVALDGLTIKEVKQLLKDTAWRRVKAVWREKAKGSSKLEMTGKLMDNECKACCVGMDCKRHRRVMAKLRGGTAELGIEIGRWHGLRREDRVCKECGSGEVEDTEHFVMRCAYVVKERKRLENLMSSGVK